MSPRAVLDLGSNTFHLLIAEVAGGRIVREMYRERRFVRLAAGGGNRIGADAFARGLVALRHFRAVADRHGCRAVTTVGTAMLRTAANGPDFMAEAATLGLPVRLLSGAEEAALIARGVAAALPADAGRTLALDIGGGSLEFILATGSVIHFARSFPLGLAILHRRYHAAADPVTPPVRERLRRELTETLSPVRAALADYTTHHLVGVAGSFEVLGEGPGQATAWAVPVRRVRELIAAVTPLDLAGRVAHPAVPPERAELIVMALLLTELVLDLIDAERFTVSAYALKEGVLLGEM